MAAIVDAIKAMQSSGCNYPEMLARFGYGRLGLTREPAIVSTALKSALGA
jgi:hypothetical protein